MCSSRTLRSTSSRCDTPAHRKSARGAMAFSCLTSARSSSPCQRCSARLPGLRATARSAITTTPAPAAADRSVDAGDGAGEAFDRRGLTDVERLALGDAPVVVDQADDPGGVPPRQRVRDEAAQLSGSDDGDLAHAVRYCNTHAIAHWKGGGRHWRLAGHRLRDRAALAAQGVKVAITGRNESHLAEARQKLERLSPERRRDKARRRAALRRRRRGDRRDGPAVRRSRHPREQRRRRRLRQCGGDDACSMGRRHRHEPDRRVQRLPRGAAAPAPRAAAGSSSTSAAWPARILSPAPRRTARRRRASTPSAKR